MGERFTWVCCEICSAPLDDDGPEWICVECEAQEALEQAQEDRDVWGVPPSPAWSDERDRVRGLELADEEDRRG